MNRWTGYERFIAFEQHVQAFFIAFKRKRPIELIDRSVEVLVRFLQFRRHLVRIIKIGKRKFRIEITGIKHFLSENLDDFALRILRIWPRECVVYNTS